MNRRTITGMLGIALILFSVLLLVSSVHATQYEYVPAGVKISWDPVQNATKYQISRSVDNTTWTFLSNSTSTLYTDHPAESNLYYYKIDALNSTNATIHTDYLNLKFYPPATPQGFTAIYQGEKIHLSWNSVANAKYHLYRGEESGKEIIIADLTATNYTDSNIIAGHTYYYYIEAYNSTGISAHSVEIKVTPSAGAGYITTQGVSFNTYLLAFGAFLLIVSVPIALYGSKEHRDVAGFALLSGVLLIVSSYALARYFNYPAGSLSVHGIALNAIIFWTGLVFFAIGIVVLLAAKAERKMSEHEDVGAFLIAFGLMAMIISWVLEYFLR